MSNDTTTAPALDHLYPIGPALPLVVEFPAYKREFAEKKIAKENARLAKAGSDQRFEFTYEEIFRKVARGGVRNEDTGIWIIEPVYVDAPFVRITQAAPLDITLGDFTFVASLVFEEAGVTVHSAPGQELNGFEPKGDASCDHCHLDRARTRVYLVRNNVTGELVQLGHNCIELFTGLSPKGLSALAFDEELKGLSEDDEVGGSFGPRDYAADVDWVIALAFAYTDGGRNYVSAKVDWKRTTAQAVRGHVFNGYPLRSHFGKGYEGDAAYAAAVEEFVNNDAKANQLVAEGTTIAAIKATAETVAADSDYGRNLRVILAGERVSGRNLGVLVSIVAVYARELSLRAEREAAAANPAAQGFLAEVGTRIKTTISLKLTRVKVSDGDYGTSTWVVGNTPEGHVVTWSASKFLDVEVGDTLVLKAATVKDHKVFNGVDQTVLTRAVVA